MAEESESGVGSGLLSRLWGALSLWPSDGEEPAEDPRAATPLPQEFTECRTAQAVEKSETTALPESSETTDAGQASPELRASESGPASGATVDSSLRRSSASEDSDNPFSIFGLPTPTRQPEGESRNVQDRPAKGKGRGKKGRKGNDRKNPAQLSTSSKKSPMRTARDVISRIQWDRNLPEDYFDIGYLDRFLGVVEKPFGSFTWGDLPWQEYDVLAIPQHRIQYFKYRGSKVWDKASRLDAVFGSAGCSEDIEAAMTRIDAEVERERQLRAAAAAEKLLADPVDATDPFADSSEDEEDGVQVSLQSVASAPSGTVPDEARSTHFLAVRVSNPEVLAAAERVQTSVVRHDPTLGACTMRSTLFHITLCMLRLEDVEAASAAGRCLHDAIADLGQILRDDEDRVLRMRGLKTFGARVLYSPVIPCSSFNEVVETLRSRLADVAGVHITNAFDYVPHMTLLKVSRPVARARRSRFIDAAGYASLEEEELGQQRFDNVNLCAIDADCALDGFYVTESSVTF